jgi:hypothetical protein
MIAWEGACSGHRRFEQATDTKDTACAAGWKGDPC